MMRHQDLMWRAVIQPHHVTMPYHAIPCNHATSPGHIIPPCRHGMTYDMLHHLHRRQALLSSAGTTGPAGPACGLRMSHGGCNSPKENLQVDGCSLLSFILRAVPGSTPQWVWAGNPGVAGGVWAGIRRGWLAMDGRLPHTRMAGGVEPQGARGRAGGRWSEEVTWGWRVGRESSHRGTPRADARITQHDGSAWKTPIHAQAITRDPAPTCGSPSMMVVDATAHTTTMCRRK